MRKQMEVRNARTFEYFNKFIEDNDCVLDVGCRDGELRTYLEGKRKIRYFGIDPCVETKGKFTRAIIEEFKTQYKYDIIAMSHVLEHTQSPYLALKNAKDLLEYDGKILLAVPNIYTFKFLQVIPFNLKNYPKGNVGHYQEFTKMELGNLCRDLGLKIVDYQPQGFECVLINLPWFLQRTLSWLLPWFSTELNFVLVKNDKGDN